MRLSNKKESAIENLKSAILRFTRAIGTVCLSVLIVQMTLVTARAQNVSEVKQVEVNGVRPDPERVAYEKLLDALALFEKDHKRAPNAILQFRLLPKHKFDSSNLKLSIRNGEEKIPVPLDTDLVFDLPIIDRLRGTDAYLVVNKNSDNFRWSTYVHEQGSERHSIRMGDLRVTCRLNLKVGLTSFIGPLGLVYAKTYDDPCLDAPSVNPYGFHSFHPIFNVRITDGERKKDLETK